MIFAFEASHTALSVASLCIGADNAASSACSSSFDAGADAAACEQEGEKNHSERLTD